MGVAFQNKFIGMIILDGQSEDQCDRSLKENISGGGGGQNTSRGKYFVRKLKLFQNKNQILRFLIEFHLTHT